MGLIRAILGFFILSWDRMTSPEPMKRDPARQRQIDAETKSYTLYQLEACPFCVKVRRQMRRLALDFPMKDIGTSQQASEELLTGGKQDQVPCLRIDSTKGTEWMYESSAINEFLEKKFAT